MNENEQDLMISSQTQGKTTNPMDNQQETKEKILRIKTGLPKHGTQWARASK
jgi:hypothetical protein